MAKLSRATREMFRATQPFPTQSSFPEEPGRYSGRRTQVAPCIPKQAGSRSGRRIQVGPRTLLAHDLGPNFRGRIPCPSRKRRPKEAGRCSGQWTQVGTRILLAHDLGPHLRIPCPSRKRRPKEARRCSGRGTQICPAHA